MVLIQYFFRISKLFSLIVYSFAIFLIRKNPENGPNRLPGRGKQYTSGFIRYVKLKYLRAKRLNGLTGQPIFVFFVLLHLSGNFPGLSFNLKPSIVYFVFRRRCKLSLRNPACGVAGYEAVVCYLKRSATREMR